MTDEEFRAALELAAERGADKAIRKLTNQALQDVGKTVVKRFVESLGILIIAVVIYAAQKGWFK